MVDTFDVSARKFHQVAVIVVIAAAFVVGAASPIAAVFLLLLAGIVMLVGRFWWPADVFRQLAWRVLEPRGILRRREVMEDHATRRVARVIGGAVFLISGALVLVASAWAWLLVGAVGVMIMLDAAFDFCVLCELNYRYAALRARTGKAA